MTYQKDLKRVMILYPEVETFSGQDMNRLVNIHNIVDATIGTESDKNRGIVIKAYLDGAEQKLSNANDYYHLVFKTAANLKEIKKVAYPHMHSNEDIQAEHDIEKWSGLVYKIYDAVSNGDMNLTAAIDYYAGTLDSETMEDEKFKRWVKYFSTGEHLKYSAEDSEIKKSAYQFPLTGIGNYPGGSGYLSEEIENKLNLLGNSKSGKLPNENPQNEYNDWKNKLYSAIRRIDKLLRTSDAFIDRDTHRELADLLHSFDQEVRGLRHQVTASDLAFKYSNKFKKIGFDEGYSTFRKYAQEMSPDPMAMSEIDEELAVPPQSAPPQPQSAPPQSQAAPGAVERGKSIYTDYESGGNSPLTRALSGGSGASYGEYEELAGPIDIGNAVSKLEEIAGRLSDRRTIRLLAEFDIMLDKIGIAAMFPELAEAQSKLIDGYSYALTRVTKMLGMLSSGKNIAEISDAKKSEIEGRTLREVNKVFDESNAQEPSRGAESIQQGISEDAESDILPTPAPTLEPERPLE